MANLSKALPHLLAVEGGHVDDPADPGGETYAGISRRYHPSWPGWVIIDAEVKKRGQITSTAALRGLIEAFYRAQFWDRLQGDLIPYQALADELLDQSVNLGVHRAVTHLQGALNAGNVGGSKYPDVEPDGKLGPATLDAMRAALKIGRGPMLVVAIKCQQGCYYLQRMQARPENESFIGWFSRI